MLPLVEGEDTGIDGEVELGDLVSFSFSAHVADTEIEGSLEVDWGVSSSSLSIGDDFSAAVGPSFIGLIGSVGHILDDGEVTPSDLVDFGEQGAPALMFFFFQGRTPERGLLGGGHERE